METAWTARAHLVILTACAFSVQPQVATAQAPVVAFTGAAVIDGTGVRPVHSLARR